MGAFRYTVRDKDTGEILFVGGESAAAKYIGCTATYMSILAKKGITKPGKSVFKDFIVTRELNAITKCVDCGVVIHNAGPKRKRCDRCRSLQDKKLAKEKRDKAKALTPSGVPSYFVTQKEMQMPCIGCFYLGGENYINRSCNYIFIEGHSRGCPPGAGCTKRKEIGE